jgi:hypothetical protein
MAAGRRHFEHPLGAFLALDLGQVGIAGAILGHQRLRRRQRLLAAQMVDQRQQRGRGDDRRLVAVAIVVMRRGIGRICSAARNAASRRLAASLGAY